MKKINLVVIGTVMAALVATWIYFSPRTIKVAYVDNNILMTKYEGMKNARTELDKKAAVLQANADTLLQQWQNELKSYEKERAGLSKKERVLKEELLYNKQQQISQYQEATKMKSKEEEQKITQTVLNDVNDYINEYGKKHGYTFILGATGAGNLVYAKKSRDITEEILKGLNKEYKH